MNIWTQFQEIFKDALKLIADRLTFVGDYRWALAIVLLTVVVRTALLPLAIKQIRSMQAMSRLQPEIKRLQAKHKKDKQKLNQEMMELYRREGVNPLGGCLPLVAQMPVLFAMYYAIREVKADNMPFLGAQLANKVNDPWTITGILLLLLMTGAQFLSTRQMTAAQDQQQARIAQLMPLMFVFVMINFPVGLVLYWATQALYQLVQQTVMLRNKTIQLPDKPDGKAKPGKPKHKR